MRRYYIRQGDRTTAGGEVLEGDQRSSIRGIPMAFDGARIWCPACKSEGRICNVAPYRPHTLHGKQAALENDICICDCDPPPRLIPSQHAASMSFNSDELARRGMDAFGNPALHDEQFVLRDRQTGKALANVRYTIRTASGRSFGGVTDSMGHTQRVSTSGAENLTFHIEETA
ncbi:PAAR domain-containing protein [Paraburkholderia phymatum]|uniref:PAAR domain-containing protein n=1 Tax=Paraburkholderia phymatum TaxID=148447 RepID=A0ACC6U0Y1_9BURK